MQTVTLKNFSNDVQDLVNKHFYSSRSSVSNGILSNLTFLSLYLISEKQDQDNGYYENDPLNVSLIIDETKDEIIVEFSQSSVTVKSTNPYYASESVKIPSRKFRVKTYEELLKKLDKYFTKVSETVVVNRNNLKIDENLIKKYVG